MAIRANAWQWVMRSAGDGNRCWPDIAEALGFAASMRAGTKMGA